VAAVTLGFWVMKIAATTLGETAGDLLSMTLNLGYVASSAILLAIFAGLLGMQLSARRFHPVLFWSVVLATSTAGTTLSDLIDRTLGLGYATGASLLAGCLALVLLAWRMSEKSISVSNIASRRAEGFYWTAVLFSNTLGTALGDFLADDSGLGFTGGALLIGSLIALTALASRIRASTGSSCSGSPSYSPARSAPPSATCSPSRWKRAAWASARSARRWCCSPFSPRWWRCRCCSARRSQPASAPSSPHPPAAPCR
jgi:hypothetical protein